jgi:NADPH:quinone reductase-like Zn-dependent oxidoreductase
MKAIVYRSYGSPDVLRLEEIEKPTPADKEILIRVCAASVNPYDWHFMRGTPYLVRVFAGLPKPKFAGLGADVAGVVEAVGPGVTQFQAGDEIFGTCRGAYADYACAPESAVVRKPANVSFEQAAAVPIAACTALQGLRDKGHIQPGQKVLVNGGSGGVGSFGVQIAKSYGADVTAVSSTRNLDLVRSIGADRAIDYTCTDFTRGSDRYDLILDCVGNHSPSALRRILSPGGISVGAGGTTDNWLIGPMARALHTAVLSLGNRKLVGLLAKANQADLTILADLMETGKVTPVIDRRYPLREAPAAIRYLEAGHARGKVLILP